MVLPEGIDKVLTDATDNTDDCLHTGPGKTSAKPAYQLSFTQTKISSEAGLFLKDDRDKLVIVFKKDLCYL
ncbi:hypothetical protein BUE76_16710 [Cnuella takakiae]|nr:hypothetical protein BUE76_16710 [Cnuella takakiae]